MQNYLTVIDIVTVAMIAVMVLLIHENSYLDKTKKRRMYLTYLFIFIALAAEWLALILNGAPMWTIPLHKFVKCMDYVLTPLAGIMVIGQVAKWDKIQKGITILIVGNAVLEVISCFTGWTFYIDAQNVYGHGPAYMIYSVVYVVTMLAVFVEFYLYGRNYEKQNRASLVGIICMIILGIVIQEIFDWKVCYLILTVSAIMLYIHYSEFAQRDNEADLKRHKELLETDTLSGLYSRYAYTDALKELEEAADIPKQLVVFSVDINELKTVNDHQGHLAGDELIKGASACIKAVLSEYGKCYRTGGDEFIAFLYIDAEKAYDLKVQLLKTAEEWAGELVKKLSLSVGYAAATEVQDFPTIEKLVSYADERMYEDKARYYMQSGKNRRKTDTKNREAIERQQKEYIDIISAFASDVTGLYVIDRKKHEVTAYRISDSDHRIRSGVPVKLGFEAAMKQFIDKVVHPDDKEMMAQSIRIDFIQRELEGRKSFMYHFRTLINGEIQYHFMKCLKNSDQKDYDKIIVSFCPEDNLIGRMSIQEFMKIGSENVEETILLVSSSEAEQQRFVQIFDQEYRCMTTDRGEDAIELLRNHYNTIAVVVYEEDLPGMHIREFLKVIQDDILVSSIPVAVVIGNDREEEKAACVELGVVDFFYTPFSPSVVRRRLKNIMKMKSILLSLDEIEVDELTGLFTKQAFLYHARTLLDASPGESFTVVLSDILNFKMYNSIYGEAKGDELLKRIGTQLRSMVKSGISARYGADQFIIIVKSSAEEVITYLEEFEQVVDQENVVFKYGIYEAVDPSLEISRICDRALQAMKSIKHNYDRSYAVFDGPVSKQQLKAQMYESQFRSAMDKHEFVVWYQPKYSPYTEKIIGAEALVRWQKEDGSIVSPGEFLPVFEEDGLISQLDEYVFRCVCEQQRKWKHKGKPLIPISVNLSRNSMHRGDVVKRYKKIVEEYEITSDVVPIELTESAASGNYEIKPLADAFYEAGFSLHMDDFGSGNSSIAGLNLLHFDTVKLDRSLIQFIGDEHGNLVLMYTVALGKELGLKIIAEGVETQDQIEYLKDIGCEGVQGYYYCKPLPVAEFEQEVTKNMDFVEAKYDYRYKLTAADSVVSRAMDRVIQRMPGGFFTYRSDNGCILSSNSFLWEMFGCDSEAEFMQLVGGVFQGMVYPEDLERVEQYITHQIQGDAREMDYVEYRIIKKDGTMSSVVDYGHLDHQPDGDIFYVFISEANKAL